MDYLAPVTTEEYFDDYFEITKDQEELCDIEFIDILMGDGVEWRFTVSNDPEDFELYYDFKS